MVVEWLSIANLFLNDFFARHIVFISHMFAAVFLVLTETLISGRMIVPLLETMQGMFLGKIPLLSDIITTLLFIIWATFSIYLYQMLFQFILAKYEDRVLLVILIMFIVVSIGMKIKYRD